MTRDADRKPSAAEASSSPPPHHVRRGKRSAATRDGGSLQGLAGYFGRIHHPLRTLIIYRLAIYQRGAAAGLNPKTEVRQTRVSVLRRTSVFGFNPATDIRLALWLRS